MSWVPNSPALILLVTVAVAVGLAWYAWTLRRMPGAKALAALFIGGGIWALADAAGLASGDLATRLFWSKTSYFGTVLIPLAWLAFAVSYTGRAPLRRSALAFLAIEPIVTLALVWTNEFHGLIWSRITVEATRPFFELAREYGDWFWVHVAYSYLLLGYGAYVLLAMAFRLRRAYRVQSGVLLVAVAIPWVGNALYLLQLSPIHGLDPTPFAFLAAGLVLVVGLYRYRVLEVFPGLVPIARDAVVEAMADGVLVVDRRGLIIDLNPGACRLLGCGESVVGEPADRVVSAWPELKAALAEDVSSSVEISLGIDSSERWCDAMISPLRRRDGFVVGWLLVLRDVTERRVAVRALRARLEFEKLVANISTHFLALDPDAVGEGIDQALKTIGEHVGADRSYVVQFSADGMASSNTHEWCAEGISPQMERLANLPLDRFGWVLRRLASVEAVQIPSVDDMPAEAAAEQELLRVQEIKSLLIVPMVDGRTLVGFLGFDSVREERVWEEATAALLRVVGQVFVDALRRERADREREDYASAISHDLRAPLTVVLGQAQVIQRLSTRADMVKKSAGVIIASARRMNSMIQDLVDSARLQAGAVKLSRVLLDLGALAREVAEGLTVSAADRPSRIEVEAPDSLSPVLADADRVERILTNLLTNALRYSEPDTKITVRVAEEGGEVVTAIVDRGRGISAEEIPRIFERYYRGRAGRGERESLGLGLFITRELVQAHGGRIWVESRVSEGSTFYFALPVADTSAIEGADVEGLDVAEDATVVGPESEGSPSGDPGSDLADS